MQDTLKCLVAACAIVAIIGLFTQCEIKRYDTNKEIRLNVPSKCAVQ